MWKMLPLVLICTLTQSAAFVDLQTNKVSVLEKGERVQIIHVKGDETIIWKGKGYYLIKSDKLLCR